MIWRPLRWLLWLSPAFTLTGCVPTDEQILTYSLVLTVVGLMMGLAMWAIGYKIGRRWRDSFVCSHCLDHQLAIAPDGGRQACRSCGLQTSVNYIAAEIVATLPNPELCNPVITRKRTAAWALVLALVTLGGLCLPSLGFWLWPYDPSYDRLIVFPLTFVSSPSWPGLGWWLCFCSFTIVVPFCNWMEHILGPMGEPLTVSLGYVLFILVLALHWYVGLRGCKRGWMLPAGLAIWNVAWAIVGYFCGIF